RAFVDEAGVPRRLQHAGAVEVVHQQRLVRGQGGGPQRGGAARIDGEWQGATDRDVAVGEHGRAGDGVALHVEETVVESEGAVDGEGAAELGEVAGGGGKGERHA